MVGVATVGVEEATGSGSEGVKVVKAEEEEGVGSEAEGLGAFVEADTVGCGWGAFV
ncbi:MAG: hypothetical protein U0003_03180 [Vampirovibrionales bacterium]